MNVFERRKSAVPSKPSSLPSQQVPTRKQQQQDGPPVCEHWPPPLYPNSAPTPPRHTETMTAIQDWTWRHRDDSVVYLQSGGLLGMYRDGALVAGDSDIDIRCGFLKKVSKDDKKGLWKLKGSTTSFNDLTVWGDKWNGFTVIYPNEVTDATVRELQSLMCMPPRSSPLQTHKYARLEIEFVYGPQWFIKMPWKGQNPSQYKKWVNPRDTWHRQWAGCITVIDKMDTDRNGAITTREIDAYVIRQGIDVEQYRKQISVRDKCRAAAMLNFVLEFNQSPRTISDSDRHHLHGNHTVFQFPQCDLDWRP